MGLIEDTFKKIFPDDAVKLRRVLETAVLLRQYQRGFMWRIAEPGRVPDETYCDNLTRDLLDSSFMGILDWAQGFGGLINEYNYNIQPINPLKTIGDCILNTPIEIAYNNLIEAARVGNIMELSAEEAQYLANEKGIPIHIVSANCYHEAIVCPDHEDWNDDKGPLLGQAGGVNGIMYTSDARSFGAYGDYRELDLKFYKYKDQGGLT